MEEEGSTTPIGSTGIKIKKIFISYCWGCRPRNIHEIADRLGKDGFQVWLDREKLKDRLYEEIAKGIDECDLVLMFFSDEYVESDNCKMEAIYTLKTAKKPTLPVNMTGKLPQGNWLALILQQRVWIDFSNEKQINQVYSEILERIRRLSLHEDPSVTTTRSSVFDASNNRYQFQPVKVPVFPPELYFCRKEDEQRIWKAVIEKCQNPGPTILVIAGEGGVGKTTLMARLFLEHRCEAPNLNTVVLWLNCYKWSDADSFDSAAEKDFATELVQLAQQADPACHSKSESSIEKITQVEYIVPHFRAKHSMNVLYVFDDVFNEKLLKHFVKRQTDGNQLSCCAITRDSVTLDRSTFVKTERLLQLTTAGILNMFDDKGVYTLRKTNLSDEKIQFLAEKCCGLPLIANLIWGWFESDSRDPEKAYEKLVKEGLKPLHQKSRMRDEERFDTVLQLFEFSINRLLNEEQRQLYFAILFFDPAECISLSDFEIFWRCDEDDARVAVDEFIAKSLMRSAGKNAKGEDCAFVHQMLWESARNVVAKASKLSNTAAAFQTHRLKLVLGDEDSESIAFEIVRQRRRGLLRQVITKLDADSLAKLSNCYSSEAFQDGDSSYRRTFLHFLYYVEWDDNIRLERGYAKFGCNHSYRLIREILLKIKANGLMEHMKQIASAKAKPLDGENAIERSFLQSVLQDEEMFVHSEDRRELIVQMSPWRSMYEEIKWRNSVKSNCNTLPLVMWAINNNLQEIRNNYKAKIVTKDELQKALMAAARCNSKDVLQFLVEKNRLAVAFADVEGKTALHLAATNGHLEIVRYLAQKNAILTTVATNQGATALHLAAQNGHFEIVRYLVEKCPKLVAMATYNGSTCVHFAAQNGYTDIVRFLVGKQSDLVLLTKKNGTTALHLAAQNGHFEIVCYLAKKQPQLVSMVTGDGHHSALHYACQNGHFEVVRFLVEQCPSLVTMAEIEGLTALHFASAKGHLDIVRFLVEQTPKVTLMTDENGLTALHSATATGNLEIVRYLVEQEPALLAMAKNDGWTVLNSACKNGHLEILRFLLRQRPQLATTQGIGGSLAVHFAAAFGHLEIVRFLVEQTPELTSTTRFNGLTMLHSASGNGHFDVVRHLADLDPSLISRSTTDGWTALHSAAASGNFEIVKYLIDHASDPASLLSQTNDFGWSVLHYAASKGCKEVVRYLVDQYPNLIPIEDNDGKTALHHADRNGHEEIVRLFNGK